MASGRSRDMAIGGSEEPEIYARKAVELEWYIYDDDTQKSRTCWENKPQSWSAMTAMQYVSRWPKNAILKSVVCMMYAEHVL